MPESEADKWDNHNAIARGWIENPQAYHPVTFRKLYKVEDGGPRRSASENVQSWSAKL